MTFWQALLSTIRTVVLTLLAMFIFIGLLFAVLEGLNQLPDWLVISLISTVLVLGLTTCKWLGK